MTELIEEVDPKELINAVKKPDTEGLIEFAKMEDQELIPVDTKLGRLYIRNPTFGDRIATMKLRKEYEELSDEDWKKIESVFVTAQLIVKPPITFEELLAQPLDIFIEVAQNVSKKIPQYSTPIELEKTKKK